MILLLFLLYSCSGEANAIVAKAKARADGIQKVSLALQEQVLTFVVFITWNMLKTPRYWSHT